MRFLVFEDQDYAFNALTSKFAARVGVNDELDLVRFVRPFDKAPGKTIYPAGVEFGFAPDVVRITRGTVHEPVRGKHEWWQSEFNGAILDVWLASTTAVGYEFADWLEQAEFSGFILMASKVPYTKSNDRFKRRSIPKQGDGESSAPRWADEAVDYALAEAVQEGTPPWQIANYQGRDPSAFLTGFYDAIERGTTPWHCAYFGKDDTFAQGISHFFDMSLDRERALSLNELPDVLSGTGNGTRVLWVDCGGALTQPIADRVLSSLKQYPDETGHPITFFLADDIALTDVDTREELYRWNADVVPCGFYDDHDRCLWAANAVLDLARARERAELIKWRQPGALATAERDVVRKLPAPIMLARGPSRIGGSKADGRIDDARAVPHPCLATWTSFEQSASLLSSFRLNMPHVSKRLFDAGLISECQRRLCAR